MTINGGQPHRVGYSGQKFRIVIDVEQDDGSTTAKVFGWTNDNTRDLASLATHPYWSNPRYEEVPNPETEGKDP